MAASTSRRTTKKDSSSLPAYPYDYDIAAPYALLIDAKRSLAYRRTAPLMAPILVAKQHSKTL